MTFQHQLIKILKIKFFVEKVMRTCNEIPAIFAGKLWDFQIL